MSEEILRVFLDDLKKIRLVCQKCESVVEFDVAGAKARLPALNCPLCGNLFTWAGGIAPQNYNPFHELAQVFRYLEAIQGQVKVEFPVKVG